MSTNTFKVQKAAHTGFTVSSLSEALAFWHDLLGLPILYRVSADLGPEPNIVGVANAYLNVAMLETPDGHQVELLEYTAPDDRTVLKPRPCDVGNVHLAINVTGAKDLIEGARKLGWTPAADEPVRRNRGDGSGEWGFLYLRGPDGITVELLEHYG